MVEVSRGVGIATSSKRPAHVVEVHFCDRFLYPLLGAAEKLVSELSLFVEINLAHADIPEKQG